ncbi:MAG: L-histidine N(alpha)-methyltransferase [Nitrososphaeraceae archaeon]
MSLSYNKNNKKTIVREDFAKEVKNGLERKKKKLNPKFFYDKRGSELFEQICVQPEYYLTLTEYKIIIENINSLLKYYDSKDICIVELGSGSSKKTKILLNYFLKKQDGNLHYFPIDISQEMLYKSSLKLQSDLPKIINHPIASDYFEGIRTVTKFIGSQKNIPNKKLILFLGSSLGNFEPKDAIIFLRNIREIIDKEDALLVGFDLQKKKNILEAAYNDGEGITAKFNLNILERINKELDGEFDLENFGHLAYYNQVKNRIEMHLISKVKQKVKVNKLNRVFDFEKGETILTENSYKYSLKSIEQLARKSNLRVERNYLDKNEWFNLALLTPF